jgi:hypothetical protein
MRSKYIVHGKESSGKAQRGKWEDERVPGTGVKG